MTIHRIAMSVGVLWSAFFALWIRFQLAPVFELDSERVLGGWAGSLNIETAAAILWILPAIAGACSVVGFVAGQSGRSSLLTYIAFICLGLALLTSIVGQALIHAAYIECPNHQINRILLGVASAVLVLFGWYYATRQRRSQGGGNRDHPFWPGIIGFILILSGGATGFAILTLPVDPMIAVSTAVISLGLTASSVLALVDHFTSPPSAPPRDAK